MIRTSSLPNGLLVLTESMSQVRSATVGVWCDVGSSFEPAERRGISHLLEHMVFKGTQRRTARQIAEEMDAVGGELNAMTDKESTCFYAHVVDRHLPRAVDVLADMLLNARFDAADLEREQQVVLEEIKMYDDSPGEVVHERFTRTLWRGDGPGEADRRVAEVRAAPQRAREALVYDLARRVVVHLDLFEHDLLFAFQVGRVETCVEQHVGQHVDGARQMAVDDVRVETGRLFVGHRVELAADRVHLFGDLARGPALRPLEHHVFEEVRDPAALGRFERGADVTPDPDGGGADLAHALGEHEQTVGEAAGPDHPPVPFDSAARKAGSQKIPSPEANRARTAPRPARSGLDWPPVRGS